MVGVGGALTVLGCDTSPLLPPNVLAAMSIESNMVPILYCAMYGAKLGRRKTDRPTHL